MSEYQENATSRVARQRAEAAAKRADTKTPLGATPPAFAMEQLPDPPAPAAPAPKPAASDAPATPRTITLSTTIGYRDYDITITATGMRLDEFCDMLDKRLGVVNT